MNTRSNPLRRDPESGYTLLIALLIVATILLITAAAAPNILTEGRRDRDEEMIWRGQQYTRAIGLYYKKYGHYPHTVDDLVKSDNQIRFLRQAYKDPMNTDDGSWRPIYLGPGGALINSVMYVNIAQVGLGPGFGAISGAPGTGGAPGAEGAAGAAGDANSAGATPGEAAGGMTPDEQSQPEALQGDVIGGNLVGVGSKVKKPSIKVYNGGTTYYEWEFIWKPVQGQAGATGATGAVPASAQNPQGVLNNITPPASGGNSSGSGSGTSSTPPGPAN
jgi:type II secretory pathway pseudopilin PulG